MSLNSDPQGTGSDSRTASHEHGLYRAAGLDRQGWPKWNEPPAWQTGSIKADRGGDRPALPWPPEWVSVKGVGAGGMRSQDPPGGESGRCRREARNPPATPRIKPQLIQSKRPGTESSAIVEGESRGDGVTGWLPADQQHRWLVRLASRPHITLDLHRGCLGLPKPRGGGPARGGTGAPPLERRLAGHRGATACIRASEMPPVSLPQ